MFKTVYLFNITYLDSGATGGTVPEDLTDYHEGENITILDNINGLVKEGWLEKHS